jgi:hypothetical protein
MKTYIKPSCNCYEVELQGIIAGDSNMQYGGKTSESNIIEGDADERPQWGSLW